MKSFLRVPKEFTEKEPAKFVILPIPFEQTTSWLKGTAKGPDAIIEASQYLELYDIETDSEVYRRGVFTALPVHAKDSESMMEAAYQATKPFLAANKFVISLGGEHSVTAGPVRAYAEFFSNLSILHFDAHSDMRETYEGSRYSHACAIARAQEHIENVVSVGIRSMDITERRALPEEKLFLAADICNAKTDDYIQDIVNQLSDNVYISFDVDALDISIMPSTGTPEPGGLGWYQALKIIKAACEQKNVVGADFVELLPSNTNSAPDFLVAKMIYKLMSYLK